LSTLSTDFPTLLEVSLFVVSVRVPVDPRAIVRVDSQTTRDIPDRSAGLNQILHRVDYDKFTEPTIHRSTKVACGVLCGWRELLSTHLTIKILGARIPLGEAVF
jgi:hypothetical protein